MVSRMKPGQREWVLEETRAALNGSKFVGAYYEDPEALYSLLETAEYESYATRRDFASEGPNQHWKLWFDRVGNVVACVVGWTKPNRHTGYKLCPVPAILRTQETWWLGNYFVNGETWISVQRKLIAAMNEEPEKGYAVYRHCDDDTWKVQCCYS